MIQRSLFAVAESDFCCPPRTFYPMFHPTLSPSPLQNAFPHIPWTTDTGSSAYHSYYNNGGVASSPSTTSSLASNSSSSGGWHLSNPELNVLQNAEEHHLEYTLADLDDAFLYVRVLLKVLDQVTGPSDVGMVSDSEWGRLDPQNYTTGSAMLSEEQALEVYAEDKAGVATHYVITRLCELVGLLTTMSDSARRDSKVRITTLFYHRDDKDNFNSPLRQPRQLRLMEDWRPLLRILYRSGSDDFTKRGAALILAYILKAGCDNDDSRCYHNANQSTKDGILLPSLYASPSSATTRHSTNHTNMVQETLQSLISWLTSRLQSSHNTSLGVVTPTLMALATTKQARIAFDQAGGIGYLVRHIKYFHRNHQRHKQLMRQRRQKQQQSQQQQQQTRRQGYSINSISSPDKKDVT